MGSKKKAAPQQVVQQAPQYGSAYQEGTTRQNFTPWAKAQPTYDYMASRTNELASQGPQYVGPSQATQSGWGAALNAIPGMNQANDAAMRNYQYLSSAADVANNPYVQGMMSNNRAAAQRSLTEDFLPALGNQAQTAGGMGGSRQGVAQGMATDRVAQSMLEANNSLAMGAYGQGLTAQQNALNSLGSLQQGMMAPALAYQGVGQSVEGYQQAQQDAQWKHLQNLGAAQQYLNPLGTLTGTSSGSSASGREGAYGPQGANPGYGAPPSWYSTPPAWYQQNQQPNMNDWSQGGPNWYNNS